MNAIHGAELHVLGGMLLLIGLFLVREFASGAMRKSGEDFAVWVRRGRDHASSAETDSPCNSEPAAAGGGSDERGEHGVDGDSRVQHLDRGEAPSGGMPPHPLQPQDRPESHRKSA